MRNELKPMNEDYLKNALDNWTKEIANQTTLIIDNLLSKSMKVKIDRNLP